MRALKSDKYKQYVKDDTLSQQTLEVVPRKNYSIEDEDLHTMLDTMPNLTTEEVRDLYKEIVEGFKALGFSKEDQEMIESLGDPSFSYEAMQGRWNK